MLHMGVISVVVPVQHQREARFGPSRQVLPW